MIGALEGGGGPSFRLLGFPVRIAPSAFILLGILVASRAGAGPDAAIDALRFGGAIAASILVHELGHALSARAAGLGPVSITLHGLGGLTRFARPPDERRGLAVTAAGPGAGLLLGFLSLGLWRAGLGEVSPTLAPLLWDLIQINLFWSLFNLLPVLPLDGGLLVLYGLSLLWGSRARAQRAARWISALGAAALLGVAVWMQWWLLGFLALWMLAGSRGS